MSTPNFRLRWRACSPHADTQRNEDFSSMLVLGGEAPSIVWIRVGNTRRRALIEWFDPLIDSVIEMIDAGNDLIELR